MAKLGSGLGKIAKVGKTLTKVKIALAVLPVLIVGGISIGVLMSLGGGKDTVTTDVVYNVPEPNVVQKVTPTNLEDLVVEEDDCEDWRDKIVSVAQEFIDNKSLYVWGGHPNSTSSNTDCSGLVMYCYQQIGVSLPHQSKRIKDSTVFKEITYEQAKPGDVMWWPGHVAIYTGNNQTIEHVSGNENSNEYNPGGPASQQIAQRTLHGAMPVYLTLKNPPASECKNGGQYDGGRRSLASANEAQKRLVEAAKTTPTAGKYYCLAWVGNVFDNAGMSRTRYCCAHESMLRSGQLSNDFNNIPVGACIFTKHSAGGIIDSCGKDAGHIAIYIGDGMIRENIGDVVTQSLDSWLSFRRTRNPGAEDIMWGWLDNQPLV